MLSSRRSNAARTWDLCAAGLSTACIMHCLGLPLLAAVLPATSLFADNELLHLAMVLLAVPITLWVVWGESSAGGSRRFVVAAMAGLAMMLAAVSFGALEEYEVLLTVIGGVLLAGAHLWRWFHHQPSPVSATAMEDDA